MAKRRRWATTYGRRSTMSEMSGNCCVCGAVATEGEEMAVKKCAQCSEDHLLCEICEAEGMSSGLDVWLRMQCLESLKKNRGR